MRRFRRPARLPGAQLARLSLPPRGSVQGGHCWARSPFGPRRLGLGEALVRAAASAAPFPSGGVRAAFCRPRERGEAGGKGMCGL